MTGAGFPVPPGFVISTAACRAYYDGDRNLPAGVWDETLEAVRQLEKATGKTLGSGPVPLMLSVRSGASVSMPGMMDTLLNLGLNANSVEALSDLSGNPVFAWGSYRRFVQMFGEIVFDVPPERLQGAVSSAERRGLGTASDEQELLGRLERIVLGHARRPIPEDPEAQLQLAIAAVFDSWMNRRAVDYRRINGISNELGTAVTVQAMVFGNTGDNSGTGVAFTRDPATGEKSLFGEFLPNAQGEDVVAGIRTPLTLDHLAESMPEIHQQLTDIAGRLEAEYRDMQDIEFTVEDGKLWMLQTRTGKRAARAAVRIAVDLVAEGVITQPEAILRVTPDRLDELLHPVVQASETDVVIATGLPASPGGASGAVVFDADEAEELAAAGQSVVLVRHETSPDDFHGMAAARAIVTARGGVTSHAAVVARGMGKSCVVGCEQIEIDYAHQLLTAGDEVVSKGDHITVDGNTGAIYLGAVATVEPELDESYATLMSWVDGTRTLAVRANADTPDDAAAAVKMGAEGIGLCRTEHMFLGATRTEAMRRMIMAPNAVARREALSDLEPLQTRDFEGIFEAMNGHPVTIRLLDPPLHEFLPRHEETVLRIVDLKLKLRQSADLEDIDRTLDEINALEDVLQRIERLQEANPMLGHRGCRLGIAYPEITEMQARAIFTAAVRSAERGIIVEPEIMIPLVAFTTEFDSQAEIVRKVADDVFSEHGLGIDYLVGTMIELPRAALTADEIAASAEFFSFGTNDLTQSTAGLSRDDAGRFLPGYIQRGLIDGDPFRTLDVAGVGQLVQIGVERGRATRPGLKVGVCGEHGGDAASIAFFQEVGLDYVSCSTFRVPVARLAAAWAALGTRPD
jgi:pyruvate,orthophosphate dikinase